MAMPSGEAILTTESLIPQPRTPLRLLPSVVEAPQVPACEADPFETDVMLSVIYAAVRGEFTDLNAVAFVTPRDPDEIPIHRDPRNSYTRPEKLRITHASEL